MKLELRKMVAKFNTVFNANNPLSVTIAGRTMRAWPDSKSKGGVRCVIDCQNYPIVHWRKNGLQIIQNQMVALRERPDENLFNNLLFGDRETITRKVSEYVGRLRKVNSKEIAESRKIHGYLMKALDFIECVLKPGKVKPTRRDVDEDEDDDWLDDE